MNRCPACGARILAGDDICEGCGYDLPGAEIKGEEDQLIRRLHEEMLAELPRREIAKVAPGDSLGTAIETMRRHQVGCVVVVEGDDLVGILTERDLVLKIAGKGVDLDVVKVRDWMTKDPVVLQGDDSLALALHKMSIGGYRHVPVLQDGKLQGVASVRGLFERLVKIAEE